MRDVSALQQEHTATSSQVFKTHVKAQGNIHLQLINVSGSTHLNIRDTFTPNYDFLVVQHETAAWHWTKRV